MKITKSSALASTCAGLLLVLAVAGCTPDAESSSPSESEKLMLQCKDNLRIINQSGFGEKNQFQRPIVCPAAGKNTYADSYDPKTGLAYCEGHHHQKAGLEPDYPRLVELDMKNKFQDRRFAPQVKETADGVTPIPRGFPLPLPGPVEVLSSLVDRQDGSWHVYLKYEGDYEALEESWRKSLNALVYNPHKNTDVHIGGKTMLANQISVTLKPKEQQIEVHYEPAFLINDL